MRRTDREITSQEEQMEILRACQVCRVAMIDGDRPYVVPVNFGAAVEEGKITLYIHGAEEGKKLAALRRNAAVCVEADVNHGLSQVNVPCGCACLYESVIGEGEAEILKGPAEKAHGLSVLMEHLTGKPASFTEEQTAHVAVVRIRLESCAGKRRA